MNKVVMKVWWWMMVVFFLTWCSISTTNNDERYSDAIKIGVIAPLSGPASNYGIDAINTYQYTVEKYNKTAKVPVELIIEDGKCSGKDATTAAQKLINVDRVEVIVWWVCSSETMPAGQLAQDNGVLIISPTSSKPEISDIGDYLFRFWNDAVATSLSNEYYRENDINTIAIIHEQTDYAVAIANKTQETFPWTVAFTESVQTDEKDLTILAQKIASRLDDVDMLVLYVQTESSAINFINALAEEGVLETMKNRVMWFFAFSSVWFLEWAGANAEWLLEVNVAQWENLAAKWKEFIKEYTQTNEILFSDGFVTLYQEAITIVLEAIADGRYDADSMREYLLQLTPDNIREWYIGDYYFDENGDAISIKFVVQQIQNGQPVVIYE